jgi:inward rectifier potassium channel
MEKPAFDPGITQLFTGRLNRAINKDGTFNVRRRGGNWRDVHPYLFLVSLSWPSFLATIFAGYVLANTLFALLYAAIGPKQLAGIDAPTLAGRFFQSFFFSAQTLSTVGYGVIAPKGTAANLVAAMEALTGVMGFAVATGLLFGRVSRPSAKIGYSANALVAPYQNGTSLQFRVVNRRRNDIMELEARVMLMTVESRDGRALRQYKLLKLEREKVLFLPLTWTVVHPIDEESPLRGATPESLAQQQAEIMILIKAYDDTFSQTVLSRYSYRHDEFMWSKRFSPAFEVDGEGDLVLDLDRVGQFQDGA